MNNFVKIICLLACLAATVNCYRDGVDKLMEGLRDLTNSARNLYFKTSLAAGPIFEDLEKKENENYLEYFKKMAAIFKELEERIIANSG
ncbi:hypothetical protein Ciccas_006125 [Cichlidogyrus casuarinus]|uniref:Uncharacterized protein n=1 Tax=Cichlidogyrus casuarinus TaxID=1844966 RepID=A0ABD2Q6Q4_9PLAT